MAFVFKIAPPTVFTLGRMDKYDTNLSDAIESIFTDMKDSILMNWNGINIPISCKYDLNFITNDIIDMAQLLLKDKTDKIEIHWPSNTFSSIWTMVIYDDIIDINSSWNKVLNNLESELNKKHRLLIDKTIFIEEFIKIVFFVKDSIDKAGYNGYNLDGYKKLETSLVLYKEKYS